MYFDDSGILAVVDSNVRMDERETVVVNAYWRIFC